LEQLTEYLDYPEYDPHGAPLPGKTGRMPKQSGSLLLRDCGPGEYMVIRLQHRSPEISSFLSKNGFELNKDLSVIDRLKQDNSIVINIDNRSIVLSESLAGHIHVKKTN
jgi:DtxR family Mn-dependent transcriptional regulator